METTIAAIAGALAVLAAVAKALVFDDTADKVEKKLEPRFTAIDARQTAAQTDLTYLRGNGQQTRADILNIRQDQADMRREIHTHFEEDMQNFHEIRKRLESNDAPRP